MAAKIVQTFQPQIWSDSENITKRPVGFIRVSQRTMEKQGTHMFMKMQSKRRTLNHYKPLSLKVSSSLNKLSDSTTKSAGVPASLDEYLVLKNKSREVEPYLNGRSIYLVGMMGSGKTTIGRILSQVLDCSFFDCDTLIEENVGMSVAEIFKQHGEAFFRDQETEVLERLSEMSRLVVSTGGGVVIKPINWTHMQKGIVIWLDVPLECLARRISAQGIKSRPLVDGQSGDPYSQALARLKTLFQERVEAYSNASARVSLEHIAAKRGDVDVDHLTATVIAIEVLEQIESLLKNKS